MKVSNALWYSERGRLMELLRETPQSSWLFPCEDGIENGWSLLHWAAIGDNPDAIRALVAAGADLEEILEEETPLQVAVRYMTLHSIEALIDVGANVNVKCLRGDRDLMDSFVCQAASSKDKGAIFNAHTRDVAHLLFRHGLRFKPHIPLPYFLNVCRHKWLLNISRCRSVVVALLRVERVSQKHGICLAVCNKFLIDLARQVWTLRYEKKWHFN